MVPYIEAFSAEEQVDMEEYIASVIFDTTDGFVEEEVCSELGRRILHGVVRQLRPDLLGRSPVLRETIPGQWVAE